MALARRTTPTRSRCTGDTTERASRKQPRELISQNQNLPESLIVRFASIQNKSPPRAAGGRCCVAVPAHPRERELALRCGARCRLATGRRRGSGRHHATADRGDPRPWQCERRLPRPHRRAQNLERGPLADGNSIHHARVPHWVSSTALVTSHLRGVCRPEPACQSKRKALNPGVCLSPSLTTAAPVAAGRSSGWRRTGVSMSARVVPYVTSWDDTVRRKEDSLHSQLGVVC
jgi:hypothetical protein